MTEYTIPHRVTYISIQTKSTMYWRMSCDNLQGIEERDCRWRLKCSRASFTCWACRSIVILFSMSLFLPHQPKSWEEVYPELVATSSTPWENYPSKKTGWWTLGNKLQRHLMNNCRYSTLPYSTLNHNWMTRSIKLPRIKEAITSTLTRFLS